MNINFIYFSEGTDEHTRWVLEFNRHAALNQSDLSIHLVAVKATVNSINAFKEYPDLAGIIWASNPSDKDIDAISHDRPTLSHFIDTSYLTDFANEHPIIATKQEPVAHIYSQIASKINKRISTPFSNALFQYVNAGRDAWHTPGHFGGAAYLNSPFTHEFYNLLGPNIFSLDLSVSVAELDSLAEPTSVIAQAQAMAANTFGAAHTLFCTNGSSTANKIILQYLLEPGDTIIVDRGSHKSIHHALMLTGASPVWLAPNLNQELGLMLPISKQDILDALDQHNDAKVLLLTSCTYDGVSYQLRPIIEKAHAKGIKVVIDEAWYAHGRFHPSFGDGALTCGADYVTHSTHKMLSAFSQASMIHINDPAIDLHRFQNTMNMHTSTSPQYLMIASLDVSRMQVDIDGYRLLDDTVNHAHRLRREINEHTHFKALELEEIITPGLCKQDVFLDPTKVTIDLRKSGWSGEQLQKCLLDQYEIQIEKYTANTVSLLITIGTVASKVDRLVKALMQLPKREQAQSPTSFPALPTVERLLAYPREVYRFAHEDLPLFVDGQVNAALIDRVVIDQIAPYPPGVPLLTPGEIINEAVLNWLTTWLTSSPSAEVHGLVHTPNGSCVRVKK